MRLDPSILTHRSQILSVSIILVIISGSMVAARIVFARRSRTVFARRSRVTDKTTSVDDWIVGFAWVSSS